MAIFSFTEVLTRLERMGLTDVLLPFLLIFTIVFAVLDKSKLFGERRNVHMVLALVIGLLVVIPHVTGDYPPGADVVEIMNSAIPNVSIVIVGVVMLLIMIGVFGYNVSLQGKSLGGIVVLISAVIVALIFSGSAGFFRGQRFSGMLSFLNDPDTQALLLVLLMFGIIVWFITSGDDDKGEGKGALGFLKALGDGLEKSGK